MGNTTATCKFCGAEVDTTQPGGYNGMHRYGCRKVGRVQLEGLLEGYGRRSCSFCGQEAVACREKGLTRVYYCKEHAEKPLARQVGRAELAGGAMFVIACYKGKVPK